jgi:beta-lactamase regulating signal transducer with metallopeptidase domain/lipopolysaccharide export system protein LptA
MNLQSLFLPLLDVLLKGAIILGVGTACLAMARKASAANRHAGFVAVFAALMLLPLTKLIAPHWSLKVEQAAIPTARVELPAGNSGAAPSGMEARSNLVPSATSHEAVFSTRPWKDMLVGLWLGGAILLLVRRIRVGFRLRVLIRSSAPIRDKRLAALAQELGAAHGVCATVRESTMCRVPMVAGILRPVVLMPEAARRWSDLEVATALCHEFGHIRGRDCLTRLIVDLVQVVHWLNPLVWVMARQMRVAQEQACDDLVLNSGAAPEAYAAQLVNVVRSLQHDELASCHALAMAQPSTLEVRVIAIMDPTRKRAGRSKRGTFAGIAGVLGLLGACAAAQLGQPLKQGSDLSGTVDAGAAREGEKQVLIEARFIETIGNTAGLPDFFREPGAISVNAKDADATVKELLETNRIKLVGVPKVITFSGQLARIELMRPFKYATDWEKDPVTGDWKSKEVSTANLGISFEVTPAVQADGAIEVDVVTINTELTDMQDLDSPSDDAEADPARLIPEGHRSQPVFATRKVTTQGTIRPGGMIALGGLEVSKNPMVFLVTARTLPKGGLPADESKAPAAPKEPIAPIQSLKAKPKVPRNNSQVELGREPLDISADELNGTGVGATATGNVRVVHLKATMNAEHMTYDRNTRTVTLTGHVRFEDDTKEITAEKLSYHLDNGAIRTKGPSKTKLKDAAVPKR